MNMRINAAIVGVGNCASGLVQGVEYYKNVEAEVPGVMHAHFGDYHIRDIKFVAAFDVNSKKIGKDLSEAIFADPNSCFKFTDVPKLGVEVKPGPVSDGVAAHMHDVFHVDPEIRPADVTQSLREAGAEIVINYLPVGSAEATKLYAAAALEADCAFINCIPEFIASDPVWAKRFEDKGLPVAGDDIKSQLGATILHRVIAELFYHRGVEVESTYQLNVGGNTDFLNMTFEDRLVSKRISKTEAVKSLIPYDVPTRIGPSDFIPHLGDQKVCYINLLGKGFGGCPLEFDAKLKVHDSPNSAGVVIDAIRATKIALDRGIKGPLTSISSYSFKHPPIQVSDHEARIWVEEYIEGKRER